MLRALSEQVELRDRLLGSAFDEGSNAGLRKFWTFFQGRLKVGQRSPVAQHLFGRQCLNEWATGFLPRSQHVAQCVEEPWSDFR